MLPKTRGGAVARQASLLALLIIGILPETGCRKPQTPVIASRRFVRLEALLPLHPAWTQVQALDAAQARLAAAQKQASGLKYPLTPLPEVFIPPITVPPSLAQERDKRVQEDARHYVEQTEQALQGKNADIVRQFERDEQRQQEARYTRALADRELELSGINEREAAGLEKQINALGFRQVALRSQIDAYTNRLNQDTRNPVVQDVVRQEALISEKMNALANQRTIVLARKEHAQAIKDLIPQKQIWLAESGARLQARKTELAKSVQQQVEQARARLGQDIKPIPPLASTLPPSNPQATPLPLPLAPDAPRTIGQAQGQMTAAMMQERGVWQTQRDALLAAIRADTAQAAVQISRKQGWALVPAEQSKTDATEQVASALRAQWRQNALTEP